MAKTERLRTLVGLIVAMVATALVTVAIVTWLDDDEGAAAAPELVTPTAVANQPARYLRRDITVAGEISDVVGPGAYVVGPAGAIADDGLLVISRKPVGIPQAKRPLLENDSVQITGEIRTFDKQELEEDLGRGLEDDLAEREGDLVLVADQFVVVPQLLPIGEPATIDAILSRPGDYTGSIVTVTGRVTDVFERGALVLDGRIVVLLTRTVSRLPRDGDRVSVTGSVRPYDLDELTARTRDDIDDDLFGDLVERPAIVAYGIELRP